MTSSGRTHDQGCGRSAVKIEYDVVSRLAKRTRRLDPLEGSLAYRDHSVNGFKTIKHRRDPIFKEYVDLRVGKETPEGNERGRGKHRVADRTKTDDEDTANAAPSDHFSTDASSTSITGISSLTG